MKLKNKFKFFIVCFLTLQPNLPIGENGFSQALESVFTGQSELQAASKKDSNKKRKKISKSAVSQRVGKKNAGLAAHAGAGHGRRAATQKDSIVSIVSKERAERQLYSQCRKKAAHTPENAPVSRKVRDNLAACRDLFPVASLLLECKRQALKKYSSDRDKLSEALRSCKEFKEAIDFDSEQKYPFFMFKDQLFFAGLGLNQALRASSFKPLNYDCSKLQDAIKSRKKASYTLFGNEAQDFQGYAKGSGAWLAKAKDRQFVKTEQVGSQKNGIFYFPSAPCVYIGEGGDNFKALNLYYLIDPQNTQIWPYFGIAFYPSPKLAPRLSEAQNLILHRLSTEYFSVKERRNKFEVIRIAKQKVTSFDREGDPKNLCRAPRRHDYIFILKSFAQSDRVEYILAANIKNLCTYGDGLATFLSRP